MHHGQSHASESSSARKQDLGLPPDDLHEDSAPADPIGMVAGATGGNTTTTTPGLPSRAVVAQQSDDIFRHIGTGQVITSRIPPTTPGIPARPVIAQQLDDSFAHIGTGQVLTSTIPPTTTTVGPTTATTAPLGWGWSVPDYCQSLNGLKESIITLVVTDKEEKTTPTIVRVYGDITEIRIQTDGATRTIPVV
jgi:hypothetical protein